VKREPLTVAVAQPPCVSYDGGALAQAGPETGAIARATLG
jgi:hypothetical protein